MECMSCEGTGVVEWTDGMIDRADFCRCPAGKELRGECEAAEEEAAITNYERGLDRQYYRDYGEHR